MISDFFLLEIMSLLQKIREILTTYGAASENFANMVASPFQGNLASLYGLHPSISILDERAVHVPFYGVGMNISTVKPLV